MVFVSLVVMSNRYRILVQLDPTISGELRSRSLDVLLKDLSKLKEDLEVKKVEAVDGFLEVFSDNLVEACMCISKFPGVFRASICRRVRNRTKEIVKAVTEMGKKVLRKNMTFNIVISGNERRRADLYYIIMDKVLDEVDAKPDDYRPDKLLFVFLGKRYAYVEFEGFIGPSGIPIGVMGRSLILFDGSLKSYVAALKSSRSGFTPYLLFLIPAKSPPNYLRRGFFKAWTLVKCLPMRRITMYTLSVEDEALNKYGFHSLLIKLASKIAKRIKAKVIVFGINYVRNLESILKVCSIPIKEGILTFLPNLGMGSHEILSSITDWEDRYKLDWVEWNVSDYYPSFIREVKEEEIEALLGEVIKVEVDRGPVGWHKALDRYLSLRNKGS